MVFYIPMNSVGGFHFSPYPLQNLSVFNDGLSNCSEVVSHCSFYLHFPNHWASQVVLVEPTCQCRRHKRPRFDPWVREYPLEKRMATHSSILAWEIPCTQEPGRLQSMGSQKESDMPQRLHNNMHLQTMNQKRGRKMNVNYLKVSRNIIYQQKYQVSSVRVKRQKVLRKGKDYNECY